MNILLTDSFCVTCKNNFTSHSHVLLIHLFSFWVNYPFERGSTGLHCTCLYLQLYLSTWYSQTAFALLLYLEDQRRLQVRWTDWSRKTAADRNTCHHDTHTREKRELEGEKMCVYVCIGFAPLLSSVIASIRLWFTHIHTHFSLFCFSRKKNPKTAIYLLSAACLWYQPCQSEKERERERDTHTEEQTGLPNSF